MDKSNIEYIDVIKNAQKLTDDTKAQYISCLRKLLSDINETRIANIISDPDTYIDKLILEKTNGSIVCIFKSIISIFKYSDLHTTHCHIHNKWKDALKPYLQVHNEKWENNIPSDRTIACEVTWKDIIDKYNHISRTKPYSIEHVTLALYTIIPPRRQTDYWKIAIIRNENDRENIDKLSTSILDMTLQPSELRVIKYKTHKFYNDWVKILPISLDKILRTYIANNINLKYVFQTREGESYKTHRAFADANNKILKKATGNDKMSVNILRHAAATYVHRHPTMSMKDKRHYAIDMGHNYLTQSHYTLENVL